MKYNKRGTFGERKRENIGKKDIMHGLPIRERQREREKKRERERKERERATNNS